MAVKMNLRVITTNHAADPEVRFLKKSISKSNDCATAKPTVWELRTNLDHRNFANIKALKLFIQNARW